MIVSQMTIAPSKSINHSVSPWWRGSALHLFTLLYNERGEKMSKTYLKTKLGAEAVKPVLNLMEQIWPDTKKFAGKDVNKLII